MLDTLSHQEVQTYKVQMANKQIKQCSTSLGIRKIHESQGWYVEDQYFMGRILAGFNCSL